MYTCILPSNEAAKQIGQARISVQCHKRSYRGFQQLGVIYSAKRTACNRITKSGITRWWWKSQRRHNNSSGYPKKYATTCKKNYDDTKQQRYFQHLFLHLTACDCLIRFRLFDRWSIASLPLSLIRCGSLDPSYPRRWQQADNTRDQRLSSPLPLGCFWWFRCGTGRQTRGGMIEWKTKTCVCISTVRDGPQKNTCTALTSCEPWEKFRRAIFIPALTISWSLGTDRDAGPERNRRENMFLH